MGRCWPSASGVTPEQRGGKLENAYDLFHPYYTCFLRKEFVEACRSYNTLLKLKHNECTWKYLSVALLRLKETQGVGHVSGLCAHWLFH